MVLSAFFVLFVLMINPMDISKMDDLIQNFINQLEEAITIGEQIKLVEPKNELRNIVISGLGGSGIGGNMTYEFCKSELRIPIQVNKAYFVPKYVNEHSLVIISSYSGNTEETLSAMEDAYKKGAYIVCISSGGKVIEFAKEKCLSHIIVPGGMPPRSCLGYSLVQQLYVMKNLGLTSSIPLDNMNKAIALLKEEQDDIKTQAKVYAKEMMNKKAVIYINAWMEPVAVRWRQQINENSKQLCWHHVIPEMNHNELVGWRNQEDDLYTIFLRNENDYDRIQQRMEINSEVIKKCCPNVVDIYSKGESHVEKALYLIHLGDWVSYYIAEEKQIDSVEVEVIDYLKSELAKA